MKSPTTIKFTLEQNITLTATIKLPSTQSFNQPYTRDYKPAYELKPNSIILELDKILSHTFEPHSPSEEYFVYTNAFVIIPLDPNKQAFLDSGEIAIRITQIEYL